MPLAPERHVWATTDPYDEGPSIGGPSCTVGGEGVVVAVVWELPDGQELGDFHKGAYRQLLVRALQLLDYRFVFYKGRLHH